MITVVLIRSYGKKKNLEEQEGSPDPMPTINPATNHLENENNGWRRSIEGGKAEQKTQHQQNIEKVLGPHCRWLCYT